MEKMISVIVPVYNGQSYISDCLQSILQQSYKSYEVIVIDDGSTDQSLLLCQKAAEKDSRIRILQGQHQGVSAARNMGLNAAEGEYLLFMDSDDVIHPRFMEVLADGMENVAMAGSMRLFIPENRWEPVKEKLYHSSGEPKAIVQSQEDALHGFFTGNSPFAVMGGTMVRRAWVGDTRFRTDLSIGEDFYFIYENLLKGAAVFFLQRKWYLNRLHTANSSWDYSYSGFLSRFRRRELVWENEEALGRQDYARRQKAEAYAIYRSCVQKAGVYSDDGRKMRQLLKTYRRTIAPALKLKTKILFYLSLYLPFVDSLFKRK